MNNIVDQSQDGGAQPSITNSVQNQNKTEQINPAIPVSGTASSIATATPTPSITSESIKQVVEEAVQKVIASSATVFLDKSSLKNMNLVTATDMSSSALNLENDTTKRTLPPQTNIITKLSVGFSHTPLTPSSVDYSGIQPKVTWVNNVIVHLTSLREADVNKRLQTRLTRTVYCSNSIPRMATLKVRSGSGFTYPSPASSEASYVNPGSYTDSTGVLNWVNNHMSKRNCQLTAAALEMSRFYIDGIILPRLGITEEPIALQPVLGRARSETPTATTTCVIPHSLVTKHSAGAICVLYNALRARTTYGYAHIQPANDDVWALTGNTPAQPFTERAFWEAFHILAFSGCGSGSPDQFYMDFLLGITQNLQLHGNCEEGGIYRRYFEGITIEQNAVVISSKFEASLEGYITHNASEVIAASLTLQSCISRALYETNLDPTHFCLPEGATNQMAEEAMNYARADIEDTLKAATGLSLSYWRHFLNQALFGREGDMLHPDRHIVGNTHKYLGHYSTHLPTYGLPTIKKNRNGEIFVTQGASNDFITIHGTGRIDTTEIDGQVLFQLNLSKPHTFDNGLFFLRPGLNPEDGLANFEYGESFSSRSKKHIESEHTLDGREFTEGATLADIAWDDNSDLFPCAGDTRTINAQLSYFTAHHVDPLYRNYSYIVYMGKYVALTGNLETDSKMPRYLTDLKRKNRATLYFENKRTTKGKKLTSYNYFRQIRELSKEAAKQKEKSLRLQSKLQLKSGKKEERQAILAKVKELSTQAASASLMHLIHLDFLELLNKLVNQATSYGMSFSLTELYNSTLTKIKSKSVFKRDKFHFVSLQEYEAATKEKDKTLGKQQKIYIQYGSQAAAREFSYDIYLSELYEFAQNVKIRVTEDSSKIEALLNSIVETTGDENIRIEIKHTVNLMLKQIKEHQMYQTTMKTVAEYVKNLYSKDQIEEESESEDILFRLPEEYSNFLSDFQGIDILSPKHYETHSKSQTTATDTEELGSLLTHSLALEALADRQKQDEREKLEAVVSYGKQATQSINECRDTLSKFKTLIDDEKTHTEVLKPILVDITNRHNMNVVSTWNMMINSLSAFPETVLDRVLDESVELRDYFDSVGLIYPTNAIDFKSSHLIPVMTPNWGEVTDKEIFDMAHTLFKKYGL